VFTPLIQKWKITGKYTPNSVILNDSEESEQNKTNIAIRVIVDHVRAVAFIADGQLPSIQEQDM
jgi:alanyl-tRNA synthetase